MLGTWKGLLGQLSFPLWSPTSPSLRRPVMPWCEGVGNAGGEMPAAADCPAPPVMFTCGGPLPGPRPPRSELTWPLCPGVAPSPGCCDSARPATPNNLLQAEVGLAQRPWNRALGSSEWPEGPSTAALVLHRRGSQRPHGHLSLSRVASVPAHVWPFVPVPDTLPKPPSPPPVES